MSAPEGRGEAQTSRNTFEAISLASVDAGPLNGAIPSRRGDDDALAADLRRVAALADPPPPAVIDSAREAGLNRLLTAIDGLPPKGGVRPADRDDYDCSAYPEGDGRHDYRVTASSYYRTGLDHSDYRKGETCWRCRRCGDVFVAPDAEMAALDEERWWGA